MKQFKRKPLARAVSAALAGSFFATTMVVPAQAQGVVDDEEVIDEIVR